MAIALTESTFDKETEKGLVLVDFWASWCGPCRMMAPVVDQIDDEFPNVKACKVNIDEEPALAQRFGVMSIPTLVLLSDGEEIARTVGLLPKEQIIARLGL